jgi:hypothetical protein
MKITKKHLIKLIKEEISNVRESDAYDAIGADLDVVMAKLPMETVIAVVKGYLKDEEEKRIVAARKELEKVIYDIVMGMPEVEMEEIYNALKSQAGE